MQFLRNIERKYRYSKFQKKNLAKKPVVILNYHQISSQFDPTTQDINIWTSLKDFEDTIITLKQEGYEFISAQKAVEIIQSNQKPIKHYVAITFDDGHKSILNVLDVMKSHKAPMTFFINSAYIDDADYNWVDIIQYFDRHPQEYYNQFKITSEDWNCINNLKNCTTSSKFIEIEHKVIEILAKVDDFNLRHLTKRELFDLKDPLVTIGLHSDRHYDYDIMDDDILQENLERNIGFLETHPNYEPYFAFPFGRYKNSSLDVVKKLNVTPFFHRSGVNYFDDNSFGIKRIPVSNGKVDLEYISENSNERTIINHVFGYLKKIIGK
jgi:peptidoglycan/xylan/chitin deacetylase (PgdA/CDA1 family)